MKTWYAARVFTGKEYDIKKEFKKLNMDCDIYIPRRLVTEYKHGKIEQRTERMLPGYILIGSEYPINAFLKADFLDIIGSVTPEEMKTLKEQEIDEDGSIVEGTKIIVNDGPFAGCKGKVMTRDIIKKSAKCRLMFQGIELEIDLRQDYLNSTK